MAGDVTDTYYAIGDDVQVGFGQQLLVGVGDSPETFCAVAGIKSIAPGTVSDSIIDITHLRSPDGHKEKRAGISDSGPFAVSMISLPTHDSQKNQAGNGTTIAPGILYLKLQKTPCNFIIRKVDGTTERLFRGQVTSWKEGSIDESSVDMVDFEITPMRAWLN